MRPKSNEWSNASSCRKVSDTLYVLDLGIGVCPGDHARE
jgi:hypothetical protein